MRHLESTLKHYSISNLWIKISEASEARKTKFQITYYTNIFKWKIVYTHINIYN